MGSLRLRPLLWLGILAAGGVLAAGAATGAAQSDADARLVVKNRHVDNGGVYIEGAFQYVVLKREDGSVLFKRRYPFGNVRLNRAFPPGAYRLASYTRSCSGNCNYLDPPSNRCRASVALQSGRRAVYVLRTATGERCRLKART